MMEALIIILGTFYGLIIGIIPSIGATTGLIALYPFIHYFSSSPYLGVLFCTSVVASSTTGDSFTGILLGIPGANSAAATMVDGYPLAKQGKAAYALSVAFTVSMFNGLLWGGMTFLLIPYLAKFLLVIGIPELFAFVLLAFASVGFVSSKYWVRSLFAIVIGVVIGLIGYDTDASPRWTFGWSYLLDGVQIMPVVAGLFAIPELIYGLFDKGGISRIESPDFAKQTKDGIRDSFKYWKLSMTGGMIGAIIGILPGLGGTIADWLAYGQAVARNPLEKFGNGNIKGLIGCEGANNAQKASSLIPTVLFGIPGAPFAAVLISLFMYLNFEMGSITLAHDQKFFWALSSGFMWSTLLVSIICIFLSRYLAYLAYVPYKYYFPVLLAMIVWANLQYTGGCEDIAILLLASILGLICKRWRFSRPSLLVGYMLADRVEKLFVQMTTIYKFSDLIYRPGFISLMVLFLFIAILGIRNSNRLEYS